MTVVLIKKLVLWKWNKSEIGPCCKIEKIQLFITGDKNNRVF